MFSVLSFSFERIKLEMKSQALYPFHTRVSTFVRGKPKTGIFVGYGGGKTYLSLKWLEDLREAMLPTSSAPCPLPVLVLALGSLVDQWGDQIELHSHFTYSLVKGTAKQRLEALKIPADIYVATYDLFRSPKILNAAGLVHKTWPKENGKVGHSFKVTRKTPFNTVIVDESTLLKEARTQRFKSLYAYCKEVPYRTILAGKPLLEQPEELWSQMYFLDDGATFGRGFWKFRNTYFSPGPPWKPYDWELKPFAEARIAEKLNRTCIRVSEEEVDEQLPPKRQIRVHFKMPGSVAVRYRQLRKEFSMELLEGGTYDTVWAMARSQKMHQLCQGLFYTEDGGYELVHTLKLDWLRENVPLLLQNGPLLIWTDLVRALPLIAATLKPIPLRVYKGEGMTQVQCDENKRAFQQGDVDLLLLSQAKAYAGLNLQRANQAVFFSTGYWAGRRENAEKRCRRIGSEGYEHITYYDLVMKNSLDVTILDTIKDKLDMAEAILKHIRSE